MSILLNQEILNNFQNGSIVIDPFDNSQIGPNSYDVRISNQLKIYTPGIILDVAKPNPTSCITIPKEGLVLYPNILYLGSTQEIIGSSHFIPMYEGRSSMARLGIQSHISAGFGDVGFISKWTLEITVVHPVRIYENMRIGQIYFHRINNDVNDQFPENRYKGKYASQDQPLESLSFNDHEYTVSESTKEI
jgi:dCTP deaminase